MGSKLIWILASIAYGIITGVLYTWICLGQGRKHLRTRLVISSAIFTLFGLCICAALWLLIPQN